MNNEKSQPREPAAIDLDKLEAAHRTAKACGVFAQIHPDTALELIGIARQAAPEAPTLILHDSASSLIKAKIAATTASASDQKCGAPGSEGLPLCLDCKGRGYCSWSATAPSRNAAPEIRPWHERIKHSPEVESFAAIDAAKDAEITDLRAALTQAPIRQVQQAGFPSAWCDVSEAEFDTCTSAKRIVYAAQASHAGADTEAARDVLAERRRQIEKEGWNTTRDQKYQCGELALAAACYSVHHVYPDILNLWPWDAKWWKPADSRRNLVKAGALILADIERLDRAAGAAATEQKEKP